MVGLTLRVCDAVVLIKGKTGSYYTQLKNGTTCTRRLMISRIVESKPAYDDIFISRVKQNEL